MCIFAAELGILTWGKSTPSGQSTVISSLPALRQSSKQDASPLFRLYNLRPSLSVADLANTAANQQVVVS